MAKNWNYIYPDDTELTSGTCVCVHENRVLIGGHLNPDGGGYNTIVYSGAGLWNVFDPADPDYPGYAGYVNVGSSNEAIRFMFDLRGGLIVIKDNSIWIKRSADPDGIVSTQFDLVVSGFSRVRDAQLFDGQLFLLTYDGLFLFNGDSLDNVSTPVFAEWQTATDQWSLGYWRALKWVLCNNITTGITYIFDMLNRRWMVDATARRFFAVANPSGKCIYTDSTNTPKYIDTSTYKKISGEVFFPFNDLGNPYMEKYLRKIMLNFTCDTGGSITVYAYGRNSVGETPTVLVNGIVLTASTDIIHNIPNTPFKEISLRIVSSAHGVMMKEPAIEFDERRMN